MSEQPGTQLQQDNILIQRVREPRPIPIERPVTPLSESSSKLKCHHPRCNHDYVYAQSQGLRKHERIKHNSPKRGPGRKRTRSAAWQIRLGMSMETLWEVVEGIILQFASYVSWIYVCTSKYATQQTGPLRKTFAYHGLVRTFFRV